MLDTGSLDLMPSGVDLVPIDSEQELNEVNSGLVEELGIGLFTKFPRIPSSYAAGAGLGYQKV